MSQHDEILDHGVFNRYAKHRTKIEPDPEEMNSEVFGQWNPRRGLTGEPLVRPDPVPTAPTRASTFPEDAKGRKQYPVASGVLDYFPDALVAIARVSFHGNEQHSPGEPLHWARDKSTDEDDALIRHFLQRGSLDTDGIRHSAKLAWRALALLQKEIEGENNPPIAELSRKLMERK